MDNRKLVSDVCMEKASAVSEMSTPQTPSESTDDGETQGAKNISTSGQKYR